MDYFSSIKNNLPRILKISGIAAAVLLLLSVLLSFNGRTMTSSTDKVFNFAAKNSRFAAQEMAFDSGAEADGARGGIALSTRNVAATMPYDEQINIGKDSENYEITEYNASIETRNLKQTCAAVSSLKSLDYVIFENANEYDTSCNYYFKVESVHREEILMQIKDLKPKDFIENVRTIKSQIDDFASEEEILKKKLASVESTLDSAVNSYDEISRIAADAKDAESLAKIIDSKIRVIESLTQQKISITEQLSRLGRSKAEQLDRLNYAYFNVSIFENKFIDPETLKDSWKIAVQTFVRNTNKVVQDISINFVLLILQIVQYALYLLVIAVALKYAWRIGKKILAAPLSTNQ